MATTFAPSTATTPAESTLSRQREKDELSGGDQGPSAEAKLGFSISVILVCIGASITTISLVFIIFTFRDRYF